MLLLLPGSASQIAIALLISMVNAMAVLVLRPMSTSSDNNIVLLANWALWVVLFIALLLRAAVAAKDNYNLTAVAILVAAVVLLVPLSSVLVILYELWLAALNVRRCPLEIVLQCCRPRRGPCCR